MNNITNTIRILRKHESHEWLRRVIGKNCPCRSLNYVQYRYIISISTIALFRSASEKVDSVLCGGVVGAGKMSPSKSFPRAKKEVGSERPNSIKPSCWGTKTFSVSSPPTTKVGSTKVPAVTWTYVVAWKPSDSRKPDKQARPVNDASGQSLCVYCAIMWHLGPSHSKSWLFLFALLT